MRMSQLRGNASLARYERTRKIAVVSVGLRDVKIYVYTDGNFYYKRIGENKNFFILGTFVNKRSCIAVNQIKDL